MVIDLSKAVFENNRYRFIISAPGLDVSGKSIYFSNISFQFTKEPLTISNAFNRLRSLAGRATARKFGP